jgi:hypothetical protein
VVASPVTAARGQTFVHRVTAAPAGLRALLVYGLLALVLWLPFGFHANGLVEEWDISWLLDRGQQLWWITGSSAVAFLRLRPLTMFPFALAHALGGFVWLNVIALVVFALRGTATFMLFDRLAPRRRPTAWTAGALAMIYPVNSGLFALRMTHINLAVAIFLFALVALCDFARSPRPMRATLVVVLLTVSLLIYQIALVAAVFGPAVLVVGGVRKPRRLLALAALWYAGLVAAVAYWLVIISEGATYELTSAQGARPSIRVYAHDLIQSYVDQVGRGWVPTGWVNWRALYVGIGVACGLGVALVAALSPRRSSIDLGRRSSLIGGIAIIVAAPLGFLPLWAIVASIHETLKVYLLSSVAVAAGIALLIGYVFRSPRTVAVVGGTLVAVAVTYGLGQHAHYVSLAQRQERVLGEMVEQLPSPPKGTLIVVHDRTGQLGREWTLGPPVTFTAAVSVAYHNPTLRVGLCEDASGDAFVNGLPVSACPTRPTASGRPPRFIVFDYDLVHEMRLVTATGTAGPLGYAPAKLANEGPPIRRNLFSCDPITACTTPPSASWPRGAIHESFDASALNVTGIRGPEKAPDGQSFQWSDAPTVHVYALLPKHTADFDLHVLYVLNPKVLRSIRLAVNGRQVPVVVRASAAGYDITGTIPGAALRSPSDDLAFTSRVIPVAGSPDALGLAIERLDVTSRAR